MKEVIQSKRLGESYTRNIHSSGLTIMLCPMEEYSSAYALFAAKYGSIDNSFKTAEDEAYSTVPEGIAHFLEHKLFESEDGDAFSRYAKTGASANAYTSFDRTAYLFSCTDRFEESLEILLDFVTHPYFTPQTVEKEQGIIGQEIKMYEDNGEWRVFFNMLGALYQSHPIKVDIVGTVDSIAKIDADLLYRCYHTFYNLNNMVLAVAGNFDPDTVLKIADRILKPGKDISIERQFPDESQAVAEKRVVQYLPVALPLFHVGFKAPVGDEAENIRTQILDEILLNVLAGEATPLYRKLYDGGLINAVFTSDVLAGRGYYCVFFSGESRDPDKVNEEICAEILRQQKEGIDGTAFERAKKVVYGRYVSIFSKPESIASMMISAHFAGIEMYELLERVARLTLQEAQNRLNTAYDSQNSALSLVLPIQE